MVLEGFFSSLPDRLDQDQFKGMNAVFQFSIRDKDTAWHLSLNDGRPTIHEGPASAPHLTSTMDALDWQALLNGETSLSTLLQHGRLRLQGDVALAVKLHSLLSHPEPTGAS